MCTRTKRDLLHYVIKKKKCFFEVRFVINAATITGCCHFKIPISSSFLTFYLSEKRFVFESSVFYFYFKAAIGSIEFRVFSSRERLSVC